MPLEPDTKTAGKELMRGEEIEKPSQDFSSDSDGGSNSADTSEKQMALDIQENIYESPKNSNK